MFVAAFSHRRPTVRYHSLQTNSHRPFFLFLRSLAAVSIMMIAHLPIEADRTFSAERSRDDLIRSRLLTAPSSTEKMDVARVPSAVLAASELCTRSRRLLLCSAGTQGSDESRLKPGTHGCPQMGSADPRPGKTDETLKSENMQKEQFSMFMLYFESNQGRQV